jgi:hypothetical protein
MKKIINNFYFFIFFKKKKKGAANKNIGDAFLMVWKIDKN